MAKATISITVKIHWRKEESEGLPCFHCEDIAWLNHYRLFVVFGDGDETPQKIVLCQACAQGISPPENCL